MTIPTRRPPSAARRSAPTAVAVSPRAAARRASASGPPNSTSRTAPLRPADQHNPTSASAASSWPRVANSRARHSRMIVSAKRSGCAAITFAASSSAATVAGWMPAPATADIAQVVSARTSPSWPAAVRASSTASRPCRACPARSPARKAAVASRPWARAASAGSAWPDRTRLASISATIRSASPACHARPASRLRPQISSCGSLACRAQAMPSATSAAARRLSPRSNADQAAPSSTRARIPGAAVPGTPAAAVRNWPASLYRPVAIHHRASRAASSRPASGLAPPSAQHNAARMLACSAESRSDQPASSAPGRAASADRATSSAHRSRRTCTAVSSPEAASRPAANWRTVQQRIADHRAGLDLHERLVGQAGQRPATVCGSLARHRRPVRPRQAESSAQHRQAAQQAPFGVTEQLIAPGHQCLEGAVPSRAGGAAGQQAGVALQAGSELRRAERRAPGRGQLDGQRHAVQPGAHFGDRG